ncbi:MAG: T9SS type A sorting domain-containing protein [Bacteroidetes bacterium]|nr:T9SS type A sorting domain-containing protein [Bacteroidota bacterium]
MKSFSIFCLLFLSLAGLNAQTIKPAYEIHIPAVLTGTVNNGDSVMIQCIYPTNVFPTMPEIPIRSIYIGNDRNYNIYKRTLNGFSIKMGYTTDTGFVRIPDQGLNIGRYLPKKNLTEVFYMPTITLMLDSTPTKWLRFPLNKATFPFHKNSKLVLEIYNPDPKNIGDLQFETCKDSVLEVIRTKNNNFTNLNLDTLYGVFFYSARGFATQIGFNDTLTNSGVAGTNTLPEFYTYPNPGDGRFTISFESRQVSEPIKMRITDISGQELWHKEDEQPNTGLYLVSADISNQPAGVYILEVRQGSSRAVQRLVIR